MPSFKAQWEAIVNDETVRDENGLTEEYSARIAAEENACQTPGVVLHSEEWFRMVLAVREEILSQ